jgi:hypothetical protein
MASKRITFVVDPDTDQDIIRWLDAQGNRSAAIRAAIRSHSRTLTESDLRRILRDELASVSVGSDDGKQRTGDVDPEAGALLDDMF